MTESPNREPLYSAEMEVKIDEIPGGQTDEPLDVGTLELKPTKLLKVGQEIPVTVIKTIDGPAVNLADYKGKFVLIHFWTSVSKEFAPELAVLKAINEQFGKDGRLVILGINTNSIPATAKAFAGQNGMKWAQAHVGMNSMIYSEMHLQHSPAWLLVGPDGRLVSDVSKIEDLKAEVSKAVGKAAQ
jgi:peroxiredoxin